MKAALFFEDNQLCHLGENIGEKAIKVSTITTEDDKVVSIKNSEKSEYELFYPVVSGLWYKNDLCLRY